MTGVAQADFARAILDPTADVPSGLARPDGTAAGKRFDVYRNNVVGSLVSALESAFPVLHRILGDDNFKTMAVVHARNHPPRQPLLMFYGEDMPAFLAGFEPVARHGFLPDLARLELALRVSYHAADAESVTAESLATLSPEQLMDAQFVLAPAVVLIRSRWPIHGIWQANRRDGAPKPVARAEDVLIVRPEFDPEPVLLPVGGAAFIAALQEGNCISEAVDAGVADQPEFDLAAVLGILIGGRAITEVCKRKES